MSGKYYLPVLVLFSISIFMFSNLSIALDRVPSYNFKPITSEMLLELNKIPRLSFALNQNHESIVFMDHQIQEGNKFIIVRFEGAGCRDDYCVTAFFFERISEFNLSSIAFYPEKTWLGVRPIKLCSFCPWVYPIAFEGSSGKTFVVGVSKVGFFYQ